MLEAENKRLASSQVWSGSLNFSACKILITHAGKNLGFKKKVFIFLKVFRFLYEDRTRKYDPKANEKHTIHGTPYLKKTNFQ